MRGLLAALAAASLVVGPSVHAQTDRPAISRPVRVQLDSMPLGALTTMLMRDVLRVPYVISPDVLADSRPVSVNLVMPRGELPQRVVGFLRGVGLTVRLAGGTVYISKGGSNGFAPNAGASLPAGSPLAPPASPPLDQAGSAPSLAQGAAPPALAPPPFQEPVGPQSFVMLEPAHLPVLDLVQLLEPVLPELTFSAREGSAPSGGSQIADRFEPDGLLIAGPAESVERAISIARAVDRAKPLVEISAVIFEVRNSKVRDSALSILAELGGVDLGVSPGAVPGENFLRIATGGIRAVLSATRGDGRFRIVAQPSLAALSGTVARINSGSQVPTLGSVSYGEDGVPIRSIEYRDSGVSLIVRPTVRSGEIELAVEQERSSFVRTTTGVDDSPTLNRSSASATVALAPGETVAIAGLDEQSFSDSRTGFLGGLLGSRDRAEDRGELLLLIQADVADQARDGELRVVRFDDEEAPPKPVDSAS